MENEIPVLLQRFETLPSRVSVVGLYSVLAETPVEVDMDIYHTEAEAGRGMQRHAEVSAAVEAVQTRVGERSTSGRLRCQNDDGFKCQIECQLSNKAHGPETLMTTWY